MYASVLQGQTDDPQKPAGGPDFQDFGQNYDLFGVESENWGQSQRLNRSRSILGHL